MPQISCHEVVSVGLCSFHSFFLPSFPPSFPSFYLYQIFTESLSSVGDLMVNKTVILLTPRISHTRGEDRQEIKSPTKISIANICLMYSLDIKPHLTKEPPLRQNLTSNLSVSLVSKHQASSQLPPKYLLAPCFFVDELCFLPNFQDLFF